MFSFKHELTNVLVTEKISALTKAPKLDNPTLKYQKFPPSPSVKFHNFFLIEQVPKGMANLGKKFIFSISFTKKEVSYLNTTI